MRPQGAAAVEAALGRQRLEALQRVERRLELPMALLGFAWLALLTVDLVRGLSPMLQAVNDAIWITFLLHFALEFALAPRKLAYLRSHWLTVVALALPALRIVRFARLLRGARGLSRLRLLRIVTSLNRGLRSLGAAMRRRGFGYVLALTVLVTLAGSAGMYAFERGVPGGMLDDYGSAVWWTAMLVTTMGSDYWPRTPEGRVLCFLLALYAFAVFGYVTAAIASFFVGRDAGPSGRTPPGGRARPSCSG